MTLGFRTFFWWNGTVCWNFSSQTCRCQFQWPQMGMNFPTFRHTEACRQHPFFKGTTKGCCFYFLGTCTYHTFTPNHVLIVTTCYNPCWTVWFPKWFHSLNRKEAPNFNARLGGRPGFSQEGLGVHIISMNYLILPMIGGVQYYALIIGIIRYTLHPLAALMYCYPHIPVMIIPLTGILCIAA